jgi:hypothetical protein
LHDIAQQDFLALTVAGAPVFQPAHDRGAEMFAHMALQAIVLQELELAFGRFGMAGEWCGKPQHSGQDACNFHRLLLGLVGDFRICAAIR